MSIRDVTPQAVSGPALVDVRTERVVDRGVLADRADRIAGLLHSHDLGPGAVVALLSELSADAYQVLVAARRAGVALMPLDLSHTLEELAFTLNASGAVVILVSEAQAIRGEALATLTPYIRARYCLDGEFAGHRSLGLARSSAAPLVVPAAAAAGTLHAARGLSARPVAIRVPDPVDEPDGRRDLALMVGAARVSARTVLVPATGLSDPASAQLGAAVLAAGGTVVVPARFRAVEVLRAAFEEDATMLQLSPVVAAEIAGLEARRVRRLTPPRLERVLITAPGCPPAALAGLLGLWAALVRQVYLVPGAGVVAAAEGAELAIGNGAVGEPAPGRVRIAEGRWPSGIGEVEVATQDGRWISTPDRGRLAHGFLHLLVDDVVVGRDGRSVPAGVLEDRILAHPAVAAVAILDVGGPPVRVYVELRSGMGGTAGVGAELDTIMAAGAPGAAWRLVFGPLPRTESGQVDRQRLRARRDLLDLAGPA